DVHPTRHCGERTAVPGSNRLFRQHVVPGRSFRWHVVRMIVTVQKDQRCLVVGGGLLGLCTGCALAQRGWRVEVLDAGGAIGHVQAGSKGDARIFRLGYPDSTYVTMATRAGALWRRLEADSGRVLLHGTGQLSFGDEGSLSAIATALSAHDAPCEELSALEA